MKKIVCELCEGMEFAKDGGMFICQGCGTKYTAEEAKAMMKEVEGDAAPVVTGAPAMNPNQQQIDNLLVLASNAFEAGNNQECENYCNRAIELDVACYKAWMLKGKAIGWQSSLGKPRVDEGANAMRKAVDFAPEEEKIRVATDALFAIRNICNALASLAKGNFSENPSEDNVEMFGKVVNICASATDLFDSVSPAVKELSFNAWVGHLKQVNVYRNMASVAALNFVREKWKGISWPNKNSWDTYIDWLSNIDTNIQLAIDNAEKGKNDDDDVITWYKNKIIVIEEPLDSCSYKEVWNSGGMYSQGYYSHEREYSLSDSAKKARSEEVAKCKKAIKDIEKKAKEKEKEEERAAEEARQNRIKAYWEAHAEEKAKLEAEKESLTTKLETGKKEFTDAFNTANGELTAQRDKLMAEVKELDAEAAKLSAENEEKTPAETELENLHKQIRDLESKKASLGLFAGKEKKQIAEEIEALTGRVSSMEAKAKEERETKTAEIQKKLAPVLEKKKTITTQVSDLNKKISDAEADMKKKIADLEAEVSKRIAEIEDELTRDPE